MVGLQQYLPFTVLKLTHIQWAEDKIIELQQYLPFTVLKLIYFTPAKCIVVSCNSTYRLRYWNTGYSSTTPPTNSKLQQYLPFTVLKHRWYSSTNPLMFQLQQYLPFTVLKLRSKIYFYLCIEWLQQYLPLAVFNRILRLKPRVDYWVTRGFALVILNM